MQPYRKLTKNWREFNVNMDIMESLEKSPE